MAHIPDEELKKTIQFLNDLKDFGGTLTFITRNIARTNAASLESYLEKPIVKEAE